jgi:ABC-type uncharacterized transport system permease subunit
MGIVLHALAGLGYAGLSVLAWRSLQGHAPGLARATWPLLIVVALHGMAVLEGLFGTHGMRLGFALVLSGAVWLGLLVYCTESLLMRIDGLRVLLLPLAAIVSLLAAGFPSSRSFLHPETGWLYVHLGIALAAYSLITIAALHALMMAVADRHLHAPLAGGTSAASLRRRLLDALPPLLQLERLLFRLLWTGFVLLTLTIVSGAVFRDQMGLAPMALDHKTVFTVLSWLTFGGLLLGRTLRGWRGRTALRFTLVGFVLLLLAYAGSSFVLEILLGRA